MLKRGENRVNEETKIGLSLKNLNNAKNLEELILDVEDAEINFIHLDIFDGAMVEDCGLSSKQIASIRNLTKLPIEAHLMLRQPRPAQSYKDLGIDRVIVHHEANCDKKEFLLSAKELGMEAGIALKPSANHSNKEIIFPGIADCVLVMATKTGSRGNIYDEKTPERIKQIEENYNGEIEVNSGIITYPGNMYGDSTTYLTSVAGATRFAMDRGLLATGMPLKEAVKLNRDYAHVGRKFHTKRESRN